MLSRDVIHNPLTLTRRAFLRLSLFASLAALFSCHIPLRRARAAGEGVPEHTAGEFLA